MKLTKNVVLTIDNCMQVLDKEILIGMETKFNAGTKKFTFNAFKNEYSVWKNDELVSSGQALEELLEEYNNIVLNYF